MKNKPVEAFSIEPMQPLAVRKKHQTVQDVIEDSDLSIEQRRRLILTAVLEPDHRKIAFEALETRRLIENKNKSGGYYRPPF